MSKQIYKRGRGQKIQFVLAGVVDVPNCPIVDVHNSGVKPQHDPFHESILV